MKPILDDQQKNLLALIREDAELVGGLTLREVGDFVGIWYAQGVVNKLNQLVNKGYIRKDENGIYRALKDPVEDVFYFPLLGFAQCGNLSQMSLDDIQAQDRIALSTKTLPLSESEDLRRFFFTRAKGDSMEPEIHDGDLVLIKNQSEYTPSDKTLLIHNGTPKIKYLRNHHGQYMLFSLNKDIHTVELSEDHDRVEVIGVVKMVLSSK